MLTEDEGMFYRKTHGTKEEREKIGNLKNSGQVYGKTTPKPHEERG